VVEAIQTKAMQPAFALIVPILSTYRSAAGGVRGQTLGTIAAVEAIQAKAMQTVFSLIVPILSTYRSVAGGVRGQTLGTIEVIEAIQAKAAPSVVAPIGRILPTRRSASGGVWGQTLGTIAAVDAAGLVQATTATPAIAPIATIPPPIARLPECLFVGVTVHREQIAMVAPGVAEGRHLVRDCLPVFARGAKIATRGANGVSRRLGRLRHNEERSSRWHWGRLFLLFTSTPITQ
jgi:hypothetical protein